MYGNYGFDSDLLMMVPLFSIGTLSTEVTGRLVPESAFPIATTAMMLVGNPLIVKHFRPKDSYLKRLIIGYIADKAAGFVWRQVSKR